MAKAKYVYFNGEIVPWDAAKVHIFAPVAKYGIGVFEGIRGYWNSDAQEMYLFRLGEHLDRLTYSQTVMRFDGIIDGRALIDKIIETRSCQRIARSHSPACLKVSRRRSVHGCGSQIYRCRHA
jgi:branched-subunit amino acid aminotransferase/4-amino-4-deoxychorismate lyase